MSRVPDGEVQITVCGDGPALVRGAKAVRAEDGTVHPVTRPVVVVDATPEPLTVAVTLSPPGCVKVTVPVGVPEPGLLVVTEVDRLTVWPVTDGSGEAVTAPIVVAAGLTVTAAVPEVAANVASPL